MNAAGSQTSRQTAKGALLNLLVSPSFPIALKYVQRQCGTIFMLHRFRDPALGVDGYPPEDLRGVLAYFRRRGYELIGLAEMFDRLAGNGPAPRGAVAFTIDDGYRDHAAIAAPIFAEYKCPVTTFVTSGFLDGKIWFWWDQIEHVFENTALYRLSVELGPETANYQWTNLAERDRARDDFTQRCKRVANDQKLLAISHLARTAQVDLPQSAPARYAPMTWDQLRACEDMGMTFGPHTVTHPVLSRTTDQQSQQELAESWSRLRAEARRPVPIFCYPNGQWDDFGAREIATLRRLGLVGAVVGSAGYGDSVSFQSESDAPFKVRRFSLPDSLPYVAQYATGIEHFKRILRRQS